MPADSNPSGGRWYFPDGSWHPSVAYRHPALHRDDGSGSARCSRGIVLNTDDGGYTEEEARSMGRACRRCVAAVEREARGRA
jgi:hypothetical protein